ncbi:unnamed protein product [Heligmosomoides polygyrus]|uniref:Tryptophan--tRNA ligase n=1 Tax=Heligmosomoides polygyrus TaxID=6339 RepID=A0A183G869_HELPZ|nr:unnamed protein product [Heligmosomoides polygyrus]
MFRKPNDDDYGCGRLVKAKPIQTKHAQKLSMTGKDFVTSAFEGDRRTSGPDCCADDDVGSSRDSLLTEDERNKIHAKILKAELKGDTDFVTSAFEGDRRTSGPDCCADDDVGSSRDSLLTEDERNKIHAKILKAELKGDTSSSRMQREYGRQQDVKEMVREEKSSTAEDQLMMFHRSVINLYLLMVKRNFCKKESVPLLGVGTDDQKRFFRRLDGTESGQTAAVV